MVQYNPETHRKLLLCFTVSIMLFIFFLDIYAEYGFDPFESGDFSFVETVLSATEYIPGLVFYLTAMEKRVELYPVDGECDDGQ